MFLRQFHFIPHNCEQGSGCNQLVKIKTWEADSGHG